MKSLRRMGRSAAAILFPLVLALQAQQAPNLVQARQAAARGSWQQVEDLTRSYLREKPNDEAAVVLHSQALLHLSQPFDAVLELEDFLRRAPDAVEAGKFYVALQVDVVRDRTKAMEVALRLSRTAPKDPEVWEILGKLELGSRKNAEAVKSLSEAVRLAPANALFAVELAQALEQDRQPERAATQFRQAARLNAASRSPNPRAYTLYADFLARNENFKDSIAAYTKALLVDPHYSDAWQGRAVAYEKTGDLRNAEADALAALRESPERRDSHQVLLRVYRATGQQERLEQQAAIVQKLTDAEQSDFSTNREMRDNLSRAEQLLTARKYSEAIPSYERVVRLAPAFYEAYFGLGICYQQTGQAAKGEQALRRYLSFQPLSADGHAALGLLLLAAGRRADARPELEEAIRLNPALVEPRKALARLSLVQHDYASAERMLDPVLSAQGESDAETYGLSSQIRFSNGRKQQALEICASGLRAFPRDSTLEELHAALLLDCGKTAECKQQALNNLKLNPTSPAYLKLVTELLIDTSAIDPSTLDMVTRIRQMLPEDPGALYLHAKWANASNQLEIALEEATRVSTMPGASAIVRVRGYALVALTRERLGQTEQVNAAFLQALNLDRQLEFPDPEVAMTYVDFLVASARNEEADDLVAEILVWTPEYAPALLRRALRLAGTGHPAEAIEEAQLVLRHGDDPVVLRAAHVLLAKTYASLDRPADAKVHLDWIIAH